MVKNNSITGIIESVTKFFNSGIRVGKDVSDYAHSCLGITSQDEMIRLIASPDSYGEGMVDLVFVPGTELRERIEVLLPGEGISLQDIALIEKHILAENDETEISFTETGMSARVLLTVDATRAFIRRLRMNRPVPFPYPAENEVPDTALVCARIMVRMSGYNPFPPGDIILRKLYSAFTGHPGMDSFQEALSFMLKLMCEYPGRPDFYSMISEKKGLLLRSLDQAADFDLRAGRFSMDYLMSQRLTPSALDREKAAREISISDSICLALYGKPAEPFMPVMNSSLKIESIDMKSMENIMRLLS